MRTVLLTGTRGLKMYARFSPSARLAMQLSNQSCQRFDHYYVPGAILPLHVLDGIAQTHWGGASSLFAHFGVGVDSFRNSVVESLSEIPGEPGAFMGRIPQSPLTKEVIESAIHEAEHRASSYVGTEHLLVGIARLNQTEPATSLLEQWFNCHTILDHLWIISYDSLISQSIWEEYRDWYQWESRKIDDECLKIALALAPDWNAQFGCRIDDAIDLLDRATSDADCPDKLTPDWLIQFARSGR